MKKAFNFRSAIVCVLVLIMCLTAFVACDKDKDGQDDLSGLGKAKDYVKQLYINNNEETAADYTVVSKVNIAGTIYNVSWTVAITTEGADADSVKVVAGESNVTIDVIDMAESEIKYVLTATITDAKGNTETVSFNRKVPKFHVATWKEYAEAKDGKLLVVDGIVTMFNSKKDGASYNNMYIQDNDGAYYAYSMDEDPKDKNIAVGMKVRLTGTKKNYNGTYELEKVLIKEVLDTNVQEVAPININELLANATSVKDKKLTNLQGSIITLTDAILVEVDDSQKYCYFTVGGIKTYIRPSASAGFLSSKEITAFMKAFKEKIGYTATITGQALVYNNAFYMQPTKTDAVVYGAVANLTPAEQVKFVKDNANALSDVTYNGYSVTLPSASDVFTDVKIAWSVDNKDVCTIADGKATFTYDYATEGRKVKLTATYTHATDTTVAPLTNEYELELLIPQDATVKEFLEKDEDNKVYKLTGTIVAKQKDGKENGAFVLADETGAVFSYNGTTEELGSVVTVYAKRTSNYTVPQLGTISVSVVEGGKAYTPEVDMTIDMKDFDWTKKVTEYTGKLIKITGLTVVSGEKTDRIYLSSDGTKADLNAFTLKKEFVDMAKLGEKVVVYGYCRGLNTSTKGSENFQIQLAKVEYGYSDTEKVAKAKEALTTAEIGGTEFAENFPLPATGLYNTTITWAVKGESSVLAIEGNHATVTKPQTERETVTIVATIKSGEVTDTKEFTITILGEVPSYAVNWEGANITAVYGDDNTALAAGGEVKKGTVVKFTVVLPANKLISSVTVNGEALANTSYVTTFSVTVSAVSNVVANYVEYTPVTAADFIKKTKGNTLYAITGYIGASSATADEEGSFVVIDETGAAFSYKKVVGLALGDHVTVYGTRTESFNFPQVGTVHVEKLEGGTYVEPTAEEIAVKDVKVDGTDLYIGKFYQIVGGTIAVDGNYINLMNGTTRVASLYTNTTDAETYKALAGKEVIVYGYSRGVNTKNSYWQVQVARMVEVNDALKVERAKAALTIDVTSTGANFTLPTTGINGTTITWTSSNTAVVSIEGGNATVDNTTITEDTVVTLTATIKLNETADTKTFDVTITKEIKNYTVTIVAPTEGGRLVVTANTEDVVSGASLTENTVLTFVAEPAKGYKLVAIKVNGVAVSETTLALTENVEVTAEFAEEYPAMSIADFKASETAVNTQVKLTGVATAIDTKAVYIQDADGQAVYVYYGNGKVPAGFVIGKEYTFTGIKADYNGLIQLASPTKVDEKDTETVITAKVINDQAGYDALTLANSAELVTINGLVVKNGKWMIGDTVVEHWEGNALSGDSAAVNAIVALLNNGVSFKLVNVNVSVNYNKLQVIVLKAEQVVIDWVPVATVDLKEIGVNGTAKITVTSNPAVTTDVKATFVTENDQIATVDANGVVTGVAVGTVGINVTANGHTVKVEITVVAVAQEFTVNYTKTVDGANGSIASVMAGETAVEPGTKVVKGTKVTVTVAPAEGYQLASYTLNAGEAVAAKGQTSFDVTVTEDVTIAVTFEVKPAEPVLAGKLDFSTTAQRESQSTTQQVWKVNGVTLTNDKDKSKSDIVDSSNPVKLYASSKVTIECTGMTKIVFVANAAKYVTPLKNSISSLGTVTVSGNEVTLVLSSTQNSISFSCSAQVRLNSMEVYAMA